MQEMSAGSSLARKAAKEGHPDEESAESVVVEEKER